MLGLTAPFEISLIESLTSATWLVLQDAGGQEALRLAVPDDADARVIVRQRAEMLRRTLDQIATVQGWQFVPAATGYATRSQIENVPESRSGRFGEIRPDPVGD